MDDNVADSMNGSNMRNDPATVNTDEKDYTGGARAAGKVVLYLIAILVVLSVLWVLFL
jgi:hypothetical protein